MGNIKFIKDKWSLSVGFEKKSLCISSQPKNFAYLTMEDAAILYKFLDDNKDKFQNHLYKEESDKIHEYESDEEFIPSWKLLEIHERNNTQSKDKSHLLDYYYEAWK